ncbi:30S ribosomal protein S6 [Candidatus Auribacterota bacterium]
MNFYEGMFIIEPSLSEEETEKSIKEITDFITSKKGEIKEIEKIGKRRLEYKIEKNSEGFYLLVYFKLNTKEIVPLNRKCKLDQNILRNMILKTEPALVTKFADIGKE